jgi:hypothetical protein
MWIGWVSTSVAYGGHGVLILKQFLKKTLGGYNFLLVGTMGKIHKQEKGQKNKNRGERQKNSENQVTLDSICGASKKHYLSNLVLYML